jgi:hypothetical protein
METPDGGAARAAGQRAHRPPSSGGTEGSGGSPLEWGEGASPAGQGTAQRGSAAGNGGGRGSGAGDLASPLSEYEYFEAADLMPTGYERGDAEAGSGIAVAPGARPAPAVDAAATADDADAAAAAAARLSSPAQHALLHHAGVNNTAASAGAGVMRVAAPDAAAQALPLQAAADHVAARPAAPAGSVAGVARAGSSAGPGAGIAAAAPARAPAALGSAAGGSSVGEAAATTAIAAVAAAPLDDTLLLVERDLANAATALSRRVRNRSECRHAGASCCLPGHAAAGPPLLLLRPRCARCRPHVLVHSPARPLSDCHFPPAHHRHGRRRGRGRGRSSP